MLKITNQAKESRNILATVFAILGSIMVLTLFPAGASSQTCPERIMPELSGYFEFAGNDIGEIVTAEADPETQKVHIYSNLRGKLSILFEDHWPPSLNNRGDVVWVQHDQIMNDNIYGLIFNEPAQLTYDGFYTNAAPSIGGAGEVVWSQYDTGTGFYQIYSATRGYLTTDPADHFQPSINGRGDVVWGQSDGTYTQIHGIIAGEHVQITFDMADHWVSALNDSGEVVWAQADGTGNTRIFSNTRGQLTFDCPAGGNHVQPQINNCGDVTFAKVDPLFSAELYRIGSNTPCGLEPEPNDSQNEAASIVNNDSLTGTVNATTDAVEWYAFTANAGDPFRVFVHWYSAAPNQLHVELLDSSAQVLAAAAETDTPKTISSTAPYTGTYYIRLTSQTGSFGYTVSLLLGPRERTCPEQVSPAIYDWYVYSSGNDMGEVVWNQYDPVTGYYQIFSSIRGQLTFEAVEHYMPAVNNRGDLVWRQADYSPGGSINDIYGIISGERVQLATGASGSPAINDAGEVVWFQDDPEPGNYQVHSTTRGVIATIEGRPVYLSINNHGDVVWDYDFLKSQIKGIISGQFKEVTADREESHRFPSINDEGEVVWIQSDGGPRIFSNQRGQLTSGCPAGIEYRSTKVNNCGDVIFTNDTGYASRSAVYQTKSNTPCSKETEPNNTSAEASPIAYAAGMPGTLDAVADAEDWYTVTAQAGEIIAVSVHWNALSRNQLNLSLLDSSLLVLASDSSGETPKTMTVSAPYTGTYYIQLTAPEGSFGYAISADVGGYALPEVSIVSPAVSATDDSTPTLIYAVSGGSVTVKVDGTVVSKVSGDSLDPLSDGSHTVLVEAMDSAGHTGRDVVMFTVDTVPPAVSIDPVTTPTNLGSQTITGTRESEAAVTVAVDTGATVGTISYPAYTKWECEITNLVTGANTITVKAADRAGNTATETVIITNDAVPPAVTIDPVTTPTNVNSQTLSGTMESGALVNVAVSTSGTPGMVTYPSSTTWSVTINGLVEGTNDVTVTATDSGGNSASKITSITYDVTHPAISIDTVITPTNVNSQTMTGTREAGATVSIAISTAATVGTVTYPTAAIWSCDISGLVEGTNDIMVTATDAAGNKATATTDIVYDITPPMVSISAVRSPTNVDNQMLTGTRESGATMAVAIDTTAAVGPVTYQSGNVWICLLSGLVAGPNTITVTATDAAGNSAAALASIAYDVTAPNVAITSPAYGLTNDNTPLLTYTVSDGLVIVKVDSIIVSKVSGDSLDALSEGDHTVRIAATDSAGNVGYSGVSFTVDTTPPTIGIGPISSPTNANSQTISGTREAGSVVSVSANTTATAGAITYPTATTWSCTLSDLAEEANGITITATDEAGNKATASASILYDSVAPVVTLSSPAAGYHNISDPQLQYSVTEINTVASEVVKLNGSVVSVANGSAFSLADGTHTVRVEVTDEAGNTGFAEVSFTVDTVPPAVSFDYIKMPIKESTQTMTGTRESGATVTISVHTSASPGTVAYPSSTTWSCTVTGLVKGDHTITATAHDAANNNGTASLVITSKAR
ncbi:MAG TPA: hypothetical protein DCO77_13020 [Nitrospiraceae bacterium]|nr:hypothetical protein [Nitrospiraceae bacterium]